MSGCSSAGHGRMGRGRGGRSSAGRGGRSSAGRGGRNSEGRGGLNSEDRGNYVSDASPDVSRDDTTDDDHGLDNLNGAPDIGSPSSQVQGGSNDPYLFPTDSTHRVRISITLDKSRFTKANGEADNGKVARSITAILKNMYHADWPTWTSVPAKHKERMLDRFKLAYYWDPAIDTFVRDLWNTINARRLSDRLNTDRELAIEMAEAAGNPVLDDDLSPILPYNASWMMQHIWKKLVIDHWNKDDWLKISRANKANRAKFVAGHHCTGSGGYVVFRERFEERMGGPQSSLAFLIESHTKKGASVLEGEVNTSSGVSINDTAPEALIDDRAREAVETLKALMLEKYGPDIANHPKHDQELWERATGGRKKGRAYCSGTSEDPSFVLTGMPSAGSCSSYARPRFEDVESVKQTIEEMRESHEKARSEMEEREEKILEAHENAKMEMEAREERLRKEVEDSKAKTEEVRRELNEKIAEILKYLPNFPRT